MRVLFALILISCEARHETATQKFTPATSEVAPIQRIRAAELAPVLADLETRLRDEQAKRKLPSLAVGVVTDEGLVWFRGFGKRDLGAGDPITKDTIFRIGSITKVFTGFALLQLRDAGKLSLDEPVAQILPDFGKVLYPTSDSPRITIRHLVTHSSGLPHTTDDHQVDYTQQDHAPSEAELLHAIWGMPLDYAPGSKQEYSNLAMALAGVVVARASGMPWRKFVLTHILTPLRMKDTMFDRSEVPASKLAAGYTQVGDDWKPVRSHWRLGAMEAAGILYSSVADLARFVQFELSAWPPRDGPDDGPLKRSSVRESQQRIFGEFGINWMVDKNMVWHSGGTEAYRSALVMQPRRGIGVIALTGCSEEVDDIARDAIEKLAPADVAPLGPALQAALDQFLLFFHHPDAAGAERTFSKGFRDAVPNLLEIAQHKLGEFGTCKMDRVIRAGDTQAVVHLACEKKNARLSLNIGARPPHLIDGALIKPANK